MYFILYGNNYLALRGLCNNPRREKYSNHHFVKGGTLVKYKSRVLVGVDEITLVLVSLHKLKTDWLNEAEIMLTIFLKLSRLEELFGKMVFANHSIPQGYTDGLTFDNQPWYLTIAWHEYLQDMGICIKFSAYAWTAYQKAFSDKYGEDMNISVFLRMVKSSHYKARLSRIDMTADYFNFHKSFNPDTIYRGLNDKSIGIKDYKNRNITRTISAVDRNGIISTIYLGSKKSNTRYFSRIYDKRLEQIQTKGFRYDEALKCKSWIRHEAVFKSIYAHQITDELLNITSPIELQSFIAQKITEKCRFYDTSTNKEMKCTRALLYIMGNMKFNYLASIQSKDNDLKRSIEYIMKGSGLYPTLYKTLEVWGDGADRELFDYLFEQYKNFYIDTAVKNKDLVTWIKKHRNVLNQQTLQDYLK